MNKSLVSNAHSLHGSASQLITEMPRPKDAVFMQKLEVKPGEQKAVPLGSFTEDNAPKGILVEVDPDPSPADSVVTKVTSLGDARRYSLHLHVINSGSHSINAEVWRI